MPDLSFEVEKAEPLAYAAAPHLVFTLRVAEGGTEEKTTPIHAVTLRCQIRIEPARRRYEATEGERLLDLFGEPERWGHTVRSLLWTHASVVVPSFAGSTAVELHVPCSFDFNVAATKYFAALEDGHVPLALLFSGTIFYEAPDGGLQVAQVPWEKEAGFLLPVRAWRAMMDLYYPNTAWLCLRRDVFDRLNRYKSRRGLPTWEQALESLLAARDESSEP
jgi:hypothetical protein